VKKLLRLENWAIVEIGSGSVKLIGNVYGLPEGSKLKEGQSIMTSERKTIDIPNRVAYTQNSTYSLGKPMEASALGSFEDLLKNARVTASPLPDNYLGESRANVRTVG
jgi:hypothetical protein